MNRSLRGSEPHSSLIFSSGFTLIELLIAMSIVAILGMVVVPAMQSLLERTSTTASLNQISGLVRYARSESVMKNSVTTLCPSQDGQNCHNGLWQDGVILFVDNNINGKLDAGEEILRKQIPFLKHGSLDWRSLRNKIQFDTQGMPRGTVGSFIYCPNSKQADRGGSLVLSFQGRLRKGLDTNNDGIQETGSHKNISC